MLPFSPFDPATIPAEVDAIPGCHNFGSSVSFGLLQSDDVITLSGTYSQEAVDVANVVDTFYSCCAHIKSVEREFLQPPPRSDGVVLHAGAFLTARFFGRFSRAIAFRRSLNSRFLPRFPPWFFRRVGCDTPTSLDFSVVDSLAYKHVTYERFFSTLRVPRFRRRSPNVAAAGTSAAGNDFALLGCITAGRCCLYGCTVSIDEISHQPMSCETSIDARTPQTAAKEVQTTR